MSFNETLLALEGDSVSETAAGAVPPLKTLYFYLTEGCNLRCRHCWIEPPYQSVKRQYPALDPELFRYILQQAKGPPRRLGGICGDCLMKGICLGSCIAQNYYRSRNLCASNWFCDEAAKLGLFPGTRLRAGAIHSFGDDGVRGHAGLAASG